MADARAQSSFSFSKFVSSAPGKIILSGEHAVVHHAHALATVIDKRTYAEFNTPEDGEADIVLFEILHPQMKETFQWSVKDIQQAIKSCKCTSRADGWFTLLSTVAELAESSLRSGLRCSISSELPMGAGLGSSASFSGALTVAFFNLRGLAQPEFSCRQCIQPQKADILQHTNGILNHNDDDSKKVQDSKQPSATKHQEPASAPCFCKHNLSCINRWAFECERIIHGNPSGVDNACSVHGGVIVYKKGQEIKFLEKLPNIRIIVTNTKIGRDTKKLVSGVGDKLKKYNDIIQPVINSIDALSLRWLTIIKDLVSAQQQHQPSAKDVQTQITGPVQNQQHEDAIDSFYAQAADLISINQHLLSGLGVGHSSIDSVVAAGVQCGLPTKLTGAGGGGCVISLVPPQVSEASLKEFFQRIQSLGFECFDTVIGQEGVLLHQLAALSNFMKI